MSKKAVVVSQKEAIRKEEWYNALLEDLKAIIVEGVFRSRWALIETYHAFGRRLMEENQKFERRKVYGQQVVKLIAEDMGKSVMSVYRPIQFAKKYDCPTEELASVLPGGKEWTWGKVCSELLPTPKENGIPLPEGKYNLIYADPPWKYAADQHGKEEQATVLSTHYPSMPTPDIAALDVRSITPKDAVLFLWTTSPKLFEAKEVIDAWGFTYKSSIIWDKVKHNVGYYVSVRHEFLLICTKGAFLKENDTLIDSVQSIERTEHSKKPERFYEIIEEMYPSAKKLEMFAREKRKGWTSYGNEV